MKITDLKCAVIGGFPVVRITTDAGIDGIGQAENWKPNLKPHILYYRDMILGLDPTNDQLVDERYIVVGWGRDYADLPPLSGIIYTDSEYSTIEVSVDVAPFDGSVLLA